jgi:chaperonin GroES
MAVEIHNNLFCGDTDQEPEVEPKAYAPFEPLNDLVLVKRVQESNDKAGSFIIPEKFRQQSNKGVVIAKGNLAKSDISKDDIVTFGVYNAENIIVRGGELLLIRENDIRGVERAL